MTITAKNEEHAMKIINDLKEKGYKYKMSVCYIQEWTHETKEPVFIGKGYGYMKPAYY